MPASPVPSSRSPTPPRIPEHLLRNIDLGTAAASSAPAAASTAHSTSPPPPPPPAHGRDLEAGVAKQQGAVPRRPAPGAAGHVAAAEADGPQAAAEHQHASSTLALVLAQCKRFDIELAATFLSLILVTTACSIFTKDQGWFSLEAPLRQLVGTSDATVVYTIGLSTYTAQAHSVNDPTLVLYTHRGDLGEASNAAEQIAYALYAFLVLSLVSAAGILWYLALFFGYLKGPEVNKGRETAVHCLGLQAMGLGVALLALGTAAFRSAVADAFLRRPFANADASPFDDVDTAGRRLETEYAYHLTGLTWWLWLLTGSILLFRSCCWAKRATRQEDLEADGGHM